MYLIRKETRVCVSTPAKLNLFLELRSRRVDGFHEMDTLMVPVDLFDSVSVRPRTDKQINLTCHWAAGYSEAIGGQLPEPENNIVHKALTMLQTRSGIDQGADVQMTKRIPSQAGMGGGSSDAMAALVAGNKVWELGWSREQLMELGAELGSDVPFFASGGLAHCTGRGEKISAIKTNGRMHFVVIKPDVGLSTPEVFRHAVVPSSPTTSRAMIEAIETMNLRAIGNLLFNRLQTAAAAITAWVDEIRNLMDGWSVLGHQMSGSGTSYFALCRNKRHARHLAARLRATRLGRVFLVSSMNLEPSL